MSKKQLFIVGGLIVFIAFVVTLGLINKNNPSENTTSNGVDILTKGTTSTPRTYSAEVPKNATTTTPLLTAPAAPNTTAMWGIFAISIDKDGFHPSSLVVKKGDIVQIKATSVDGDYDMAIPYKEMYWKIPKGETKPFTFTANQTGTFLFQCRDFCPNGKAIQGTIVTLDK